MRERTCVEGGCVPAAKGSMVVVVINAAVAVGVVVAVLAKVVGRVAAAPAQEHSHSQVRCHSRCGEPETWKGCLLHDLRRPDCFCVRCVSSGGQDGS